MREPSDIAGFRGKYLDLYPGSGYDPTVHERATNTVDIAICTVVDGKLMTLLVTRHIDPFKGMLAIPGGYLDIKSTETLEDSAYRKLREETGVVGIPVTQLKTYDDPGRDPRWRTISTVFYALVPWSNALADLDDLVGWYPMYDLPSLAFDHNRILGDLRARLMLDIRDTSIGFELLPKEFTISDVMSIHAAVTNGNHNTDNFHRTMSANPMIESIGKKRNTNGRSAMLYRLKTKSG
jgi:8-oxo-dGTP diphosphatase